MSPEDFYLDLLMRTLANTIYEDPTMEPWAGEAVYDASRRAIGADWPRTAHTMCGLVRLRNVMELTRATLRDAVPGSFIETGVWRGGCCILMEGVLSVYHQTDRKIFVADSFAGLPKPNADRYAHDKDDIHHTFPQLAVNIDQVKANFERYGLLNSNITFVEGFFEDTLPTLETGPLALIRLDGDMYGSTIVALDNLYPKLSPGGYVIVDDYGAVPACKAAVTDYRKAHGIDAAITTARTNEMAFYYT